MRKAFERMNGNEELERLLRRRTGFKPGDISITCPGCGSEVKSRYCVGCGHEVTALNYDVMNLALRNGDISHDELMEGMRLINHFDVNTRAASDIFPKILSGQRALIGD